MSFDIINTKLICDNCINNIYMLNTDNNQCELNECEEYPEISPGCIICKDNLNKYKENNKCQRCKYGYFKTREEKCIYCRSEQYGGPGCNECGYEIDKNGIELIILYVKVVIQIIQIFIVITITTIMNINLIFMIISFIIII